MIEGTILDYVIEDIKQKKFMFNETFHLNMKHY